MLALTFLAQIGGEVPFSREEFSLIAEAVVVVFCIVVAVAGTWAICRRNPPIEREIDERIDGKLAAAIKVIDTQITSVITSWDDRHKELHQEMLRLNQERRVTVAGLFEKIENYRKETKDDNAAITASVQNGFNDLHSNVGKLEGMLSVALSGLSK